jgi:hypothetical protein
MISISKTVMKTIGDDTVPPYEADYKLKKSNQKFPQSESKSV